METIQIKHHKHTHNKPHGGRRVHTHQMPSIVHEYEEEFRRHFPQRILELKQKFNPIHGVYYHVYINGDNGQLPMKEDDLRAAVRAFRL